MELFIDEAGSFVSKNAKPDSWCITGLYVYPDYKKKRYIKVIRNLKSRLNINRNDEIKINKIPENIYIKFLDELNSINGTFFCVATDSFLNQTDLVNNHKLKTKENILSQVSIMKYETGKEATKYLASQFEGLSDQLYIQLHCQIQMILTFINRGIAYYVQRNANSLSTFKWRIDRKEPKKILDYEEAFEKFAPVLLQTFSLNEPALALNFCNYEPMSEFMYRKGEIPEYLVEKFPYLSSEEGFDIQKIVRNDMKFIDSKLSEGIQVVDLLSSGMRKLLRREFSNNELIARYLGALMIQDIHSKPPLKLVTFGQEQSVDKELISIVNKLTTNSRRMIK